MDGGTFRLKLAANMLPLGARLLLVNNLASWDHKTSRQMLFTTVAGPVTEG